jgi:hypothetical protein
MQGPRAQFTIRSLMIAVACVAVLFAVWPVLPVILPVILLALISWRRLGWRFVIVAFTPGFIVLGAGWFWARRMISSFQRREGFIAIGAASRGAYYEYWGVTVPGRVTGLCLVALVASVLVVSAHRRRFDLLWATVGYAFAIAWAYLNLFAGLEFEAFD